GLERLLGRLESGELKVVCRDLTEPSPLAQEILNARPYAFLDDAPLEERRTRAVASRRWLDPESAADLGRLDADAIRRVREEAWPRAANADELHDMLVILGFVRDHELPSAGPAAAVEGWISELLQGRRATRLETSNGQRLWVAAERLLEVLAAHPQATLDPVIEAPGEHAGGRLDADSAIRELLRSRLEGSGPVTAESLAAALDVPAAAAAAALAALESEGFAIRGRFTPDAPGEEWCERRLLARIHRYTLGRLRAEIEPVSLADFMRFLFDWQHIAEDARMIGPESVSAVVDQLQGYEAPAAAWEPEILAARVSDYDSTWLDALCLSGRFTWLRLSPGSGGRNGSRASPPVRSTPVSLLRRSDLPDWLALAEPGEPQLSGPATRVLECLDRQGACFFDDLASGTGLLRSQLEDALGELCAAGLVNADSFAGLRAMLLPAHKRGGIRGRRRGARNPLSEAGRWSRIPGRSSRSTALPDRDGDRAGALEGLAWTLLNRYGVLMKPLLSREALKVPWRDLLRICRRLEARGEIRGGRFVEGPAGEQFALSEAVSAMRAVRRKNKNGELVSVSAADPLNLAGILLPGERVPSFTGNRILFRDGVPVAVYVGKEVRFLTDLDADNEWSVRNALLRRRMPTGLRADAKPLQ
ncbi:MAG: ATP-dependent DNA helicase, partial [Gammaproteobacteria bacterium]|nr:ATP-dependent DNA helicase [Gammaproteobacteria bacterium]